MDAHETVVWNSQISVAVLGRVKGDTVEFLLVPLGGEGYPLSEGQVLKARLDDFIYAGVLGYADGVAGCKCEPCPDSLRIMCAAIPSFITYLSGKIAPPVQGDSAEWCEKLFQLPDTREN
jgi:hypothetical protein